MKVLFSLIASLLIIPQLMAANGSTSVWVKDSEYQDEQKGIVIDVFTRDEPDNNYKAFNAKTTVNASLASVLAVLFNIDDFERLLYNYKHAEIIYHEQQPYLYVQLAMLWPVESRDVVLKETITQVNDYSVLITAQNTHDIYPQQEDHIRLLDSEAKWRLKPISDNQTLVEFYGHTHPSGTVPSWMVNLLLTDIPMETFKNLHNLIQEPQYRDASLKTLDIPHIDLSFIKLPYEVVDKS